MRILHIQRVSAISGSEKYIRDLAISQRKMNNEVGVIVVCNKNDLKNFSEFIEELKKEGVEVFLFYSKRWFSLHVIRSLKSLCNEWKPSVMHTHLLYADIYVVMVKMLFNSSVKIISTKHGFQEKYLQQHGLTVSSQLRKLPFYWLSRWIEKKIDISYTVSHAMAQFYHQAKITPQEIPVVLHGLTKKAMPDDTQLSASPASLTIVAVGRLTAYKGFRYLIEAVAILKRKIPGIQLKIVGDGPQRVELESLSKELEVSDNILFLGFQRRPETFWKEAVLVVIPSLVEAFGLVFLEAMAYGKPVVAFDVPAGNEIIQNGKSGLLVETRNPVAMANAIEQLILSPSLACKLGKNGRESVFTNFNFERVVCEVDYLYKSLISNN